MKRPTFPEIYMRLAYDLSKRSTCKRLQVGAVICSVDYREIFALGYNGGPEGGFNDCLSDEPGKCGHIHGEDNACNFAPARVGKIMIVTHFPCPMCCVRMVNKKGFKKVIYSEIYRDTSGEEILKAAGIRIEQIII